ncbi:MAG: restriction endonuclease subunit S [Rhodospirillales bacterium]
MTAVRLLGLYQRIAEAPDAIARLRRFVLDLAVRGKLVPQDPADEPASELLKRIAKEKARTDKRHKDLPKIENQSELGDLPKRWCAVPLIALGSWAIGAGFPKNEQGANDGPYFFLKVSDMNLQGNEKYITTANNCIDEDSASRMRAKIHPPGTIIFPKIGGAIATNKRRILARGAAIDNNCLGITFSSHVDTEWAFLLLTTLDFTKYQAGTAVPALQQSTLESIPVGLPPLSEQRRIMANVDELMALCDRLEAAREKREATRNRLTTATLARLTAPDTDAETFRSHARFALDTLPALTSRPDQIKQLRQTILNLAVRGKLVEQDPADEPASKLLKRIAAEKVQSGKRQRELPEIQATETLGELPSNWCGVPLIALGYWAIGSGFPKNEQGNNDGPYFFVKVSDMNLSGNEKYITVANNFIDRDAARRMRATIHPAGTIIFPKIGGAIATNKRRILTRGSAIDNNCLGIAFSSCVALDWAYLLLTTLDFAKYQAGTAVPALQQGILGAIPVGVPPLAEQWRIAAKVDALLALCDRLEASLTTADTTRRRLLDALLHEALVPAASRALAAAE